MSKYDYMTYNDLLGHFKTGGKGRIDVRTILDEAAPKIKDYAALWRNWSSSPAIMVPKYWTRS